MNRRATAVILPVVLTAFVLTGCSGGNTSGEPARPSASTASATPSPSTSTSIEVTSEPMETPAVPVASVPADAAPPQDTAAADDGEVEQFFQTGGQCISDVWSSSMPHTDALQQKVIDYCAANQLGDWAHGVDPMDPKNYGGGQQETAVKSEAEQAEDIAQCNALDIYTATSGAIQYCYTEYGITPPGAPAEDVDATPDVAGP